MTVLKRVMGGLVLGAVLTVGSTRAAQAQDQFSTGLFTGNCIDCAQLEESASYPVTATLLLKNYAQQPGGSWLRFSNFVSFTYAGSNLLPGGFSVVAADKPVIFGDLYATDQQFYLTWNSSSSSGYFYMPYQSVTQTVAFVVDDDGGIPSVSLSSTWATCLAEANSDRCSPIGIQTANDFGDQGQFRLRTSNVVPEPSTYVLMGVGLVAIGFASRARRRA